MGKIEILIGPPCSGKSTYAKQKIKNEPNCIRVNRDDTRVMLRNLIQLDRRGEALVSRTIEDAIFNALDLGYDVVLDQTNCRLRDINQWIKIFSRQADIDFVAFDVEYKELMKRNVERSKENGFPPISDEVMERMFNRFQLLKKEFDFKSIKRRE